MLFLHNASSIYPSISKVSCRCFSTRYVYGQLFLPVYFCRPSSILYCYGCLSGGASRDSSFNLGGGVSNNGLDGGSLPARHYESLAGISCSLHMNTILPVYPDNKISVPDMFITRFPFLHISVGHLLFYIAMGFTGARFAWLSTSPAAAPLA